MLSQVVVRPPGLSDSATPAGAYDARDAQAPVGHSEMARADVALFMVDLVEKTDWDGKAVSLFRVGS